MKQFGEGDYIQRLVTGDHEAFRYFYIQYFPKTKCYISHLIKSEAIAEELSQDIFEKLWIYKESLKELRSFNSYIFKMAKNAALNYLDHKYIEENYILNYNVINEFSIEAEIDAQDLALLIQLTVEKMPEQRKKIYEMSRVENLKNDEIAEKLNISRRTVEKHLELALRQIREVIALTILLFF